MLTRYLFPNRFKRVGWVLAGVALVLGLLEMNEVMHLPSLLTWLPSPIGSHDLSVDRLGRPVRENHDLYAVLFIVGGLLTACSREKEEDEYIGQIRLESLLWALYVYNALLIIAFICVSGFPFFNVMTYALFTPLLLFLARFNIVLFLNSKAVSNDE